MNPLARSVLISLGLTAAVSAANVDGLKYIKIFKDLEQQH